MYNDEKNFYHYTYRKDDDQPGQRYDTRSSQYQSSYYQSSNPGGPEIKPVKKKKRTGLKVAALALACVLLGAAAGGGAAWFMMKHPPAGDASQIAVSNRPAAEVVILLQLEELFIF